MPLKIVSPETPKPRLLIVKVSERAGMAESVPRFPVRFVQAIVQEARKDFRKYGCWWQGK